MQQKIHIEVEIDVLLRFWECQSYHSVLLKRRKIRERQGMYCRTHQSILFWYFHSEKHQTLSKEPHRCTCADGVRCTTREFSRKRATLSATPDGSKRKRWMAATRCSPELPRRNDIRFMAYLNGRGLSLCRGGEDGAERGEGCWLNIYKSYILHVSMAAAGHLSLCCD